MIYKIALPLMCMLMCYACAGHKEARQIKRHNLREYNGIDTLIRIDGYYYGLCGDYFCRPFILSENGEFTGTLGRYDSHDQIIASFYESFSYIRKGSYQVANDTITVNTVRKYGPWSYDILKYDFVIINDTMLERVYSSNVRVDDTIINRDRVLFRFYQYPIENFE